MQLYNGDKIKIKKWDIIQRSGMAESLKKNYNSNGYQSLNEDKKFSVKLAE